MTTYFLDGTNGNDSNDGLSEQFPKKTLNPSIVIAGNDTSLYLKVGTIVNATANFTSSYYLQILSYGTGTNIKPVLNLGSYTLLQTAGNNYYYKVTNVDLTGFSAVGVSSTQARVFLTNCAISGFAIGVSGCGSGSVIQNCTITGFSDTGILIGRATYSCPLNVSILNNNISSSVATGNAIAFTLGNINAPALTGGLVSGNTLSVPGCAGPAVRLGPNYDSVVVTANKVYGSLQQSVYLEAPNCTVSRNYLADSGREAFYANATALAYKFYSNITLNCGTVADGSFTYPCALRHEVTGLTTTPCLAANNLFMAGSGTLVTMMTKLGVSTGAPLRVANNIFDASRSSAIAAYHHVFGTVITTNYRIRITDSSVTTLQFSSNAYVKGPGVTTTPFKVNNFAVAKTMQTWRSYFGWLDAQNEKDSIIYKDLLLNPFDYTLLDTSPCIGAGTPIDIRNMTDYNNRQFQSPPSIGPCESLKKGFREKVYKPDAGFMLDVCGYSYPNFSGLSGAFYSPRSWLHIDPTREDNYLLEGPRTTLTVLFNIPGGKGGNAIPLSAVDSVITYNAQTASTLDVTTNANNASVDDVFLPPFQTTQDGDYIAFGSISPALIAQVSLNISTPASVTGGTYAWQYWIDHPTTPGWVDVAVVDNTNFLSISGTNTVTIVSPPPPVNWIVNTLNSQSRYWLRFVVKTRPSAIATAPKITQAWIQKIYTNNHYQYGPLNYIEGPFSEGIVTGQTLIDDGLAPNTGVTPSLPMDVVKHNTDGSMTFTYTAGSSWSTNTARTMFGTTFIPTKVPLHHTFEFKLDSGWPFEYIEQSNKIGAHTGFYKNSDTLIWEIQCGQGSAGPFMSIFIDVNSVTNTSRLNFRCGDNTNPVIVTSINNIEAEKWYTFDIKFILADPLHRKVFGTLAGVPFEFTYPDVYTPTTGNAYPWGFWDRDRAGGTATFLGGIYCYWNCDNTRTKYADFQNIRYGVDDLPMNDPYNCKTRSITIRQLVTKVLSNTKDWDVPQARLPRTI